MTLYGPDGSRWQAGINLNPPDWSAIDFVIWRCITEGGAPDDTYRSARDQAKAHGKPFMAYTFLSSDPTRQVEQTAAMIDDPTIPVMCDWEKPGCTFDEALTWIEGLTSLGFRVPLLYTGSAFWQANGSPHLAGCGFDLVVARYGNQQPLGQYEIVTRYEEMNARYGPSTWPGFGGLTAMFWQYGSRIRWGDRYMDMNAYRGTPAGLAQWFKIWDDAPPPKPPGKPLPPPSPDIHVPHNPFPPFEE